jgi:hypothetical protein
MYAIWRSQAAAMQGARRGACDAPQCEHHGSAHNGADTATAVKTSARTTDQTSVRAADANKAQASIESPAIARSPAPPSILR